MFGSSHHEKKQDGFVIDKYRKNSGVQDRHIKIICKPLYVRHFENPHFVLPIHPNKYIDPYKRVIKVGPFNEQHTIDLIALLASFYEEVYITKPQTSRSANSEKYIVCLNFIHKSNDEFLPQLYIAFEKMVNCTHQPGRYITIDIPCIFLSKIEEYNSIFGQYQIDNIHYTLSLIYNRFK